jgi:hypothetical protein
MITNTRNNRTALATSGLVAMLVAPSAFALPILEGAYDFADGRYEATDAEGRSAAARFTSWSSGGLTGIEILLSNLALDSHVVPNEVLVGLTFDYSGTILDPSSDGLAQNTFGTVLPTGSVATSLGGNLDGEYAYRDDLGGFEGMNQYTISSSAFDPLGINPVINPAVAIHPLSTNGASFGIVNGVYNGTTVSFPASIDYWVEDSLRIRLVTSGAFNPERVTNVNFLYGTSYYEVSVPEPGTLSLLGAGLIAAGLVGRRRRKALNA